MEYKTIQCGCGVTFKHPKQRGRPPVKCENCRTGKPVAAVKQPKVAVADSVPVLIVTDIQLPEDAIPLGTAVRIKPHVWRGVQLQAAYGRLLDYKRDCVGLYAEVCLEDGDRRLVRLENLEEK